MYALYDIYTYTQAHMYITCMYVHYVYSRCFGREKRDLLELELELIESCHVFAVNMNQLLCKNIKCSFLTTEPSFQPLTY